MKYISTLILSTIVILLGFNACKHEKVGPDLNKAVSMPVGKTGNIDSVLISDINNVTIYGFTATATPPKNGKVFWPSEYPLPVTSNKIYNPATDINKVYSLSPDGNKYLLFEADSKINEPKIAYMEIQANQRTGGLVSDVTFPLYVDPTKVYFNVYAYNTMSTGINYAWLIFSFQEADGSERTFTLKQPNWTGWKLFSIKYTDLVSTGSSGPGRPDQLKTLGIVFLSANPNLKVAQKVSIAIDHPIFTFNKPYQP